MDWSIYIGYRIPIGNYYHVSSLNEILFVSLTLYLNSIIQKPFYQYLVKAYESDTLWLFERIHILLALGKDMSTHKMSQMMDSGEQTVRDYHKGCRRKSILRLGRFSKLMKPQRRELIDPIKAGPHATRYTLGCRTATMVQAPIPARFKVSYHLNETKYLEWCQSQWPRILQQAQQREAWLLFFGDEASGVQWGSLRYIWATKEEQAKSEQARADTIYERKGHQAFGHIHYCSGLYFYIAHDECFKSECSAAFLLNVLALTRCPVTGTRDGTCCHTSVAMKDAFKAQAARLTITYLLSYSPEFNLIEHLCKNVKKAVTHVKYLPSFAGLQAEVDCALLHFVPRHSEIMILIAYNCETLGAQAA